MKVGDLVIQGTRVTKLRGMPKKKKTIGLVIAVHDIPEDAPQELTAQWKTLLGSKTVDVLWIGGRISKNFAENALEVVNDKDFVRELLNESR